MDVVVMDNYLYRSLHSYYNRLFKTGSVHQNQINKLLIMSFINDMLNNDFRGYITEEDYNAIVKSLYCLYGSNCLFPYPDYINNKNKRVMYNGSISELAYRVRKIEESEVVIPGDYIEETEDLDIEE